MNVIWPCTANRSRVERVRPLGEKVGIDAVMAELIIDADTHRLQCQR